MSTPIPAKSMGTALSRVDGRFKVIGAAKYPAEFNPPNVAYAAIVMSPISKGTITESRCASQLFRHDKIQRSRLGEQDFLG
jgi:CO/xanthine dehydrogenase Mo-binding subunit